MIGEICGRPCGWPSGRKVSIDGSLTPRRSCERCSNGSIGPERMRRRPRRCFTAHGGAALVAVEPDRKRRWTLGPTSPKGTRKACIHVGITAAVARPLPSGLEYRRLRGSRLLSVPEHDDHCSRLQIILKISGVLGSSVFTRLCIYMGPVTHQVEYDQAIPSILCCASITTHIPVISSISLLV
jgi:hypothetical protein